MERYRGVIEAKVLASWLIQRFAGEAMLAAVSPRFVVALLIANTKSPFAVEGTQVTLATQRVAFFAIDSITKVFAESDVVGKDYRLNVEQLEIDGKRSYTLTVVG
jgi:hypothetical protein